MSVEGPLILVLVKHILSLSPSLIERFPWPFPCIGRDLASVGIQSHFKLIKWRDNYEWLRIAVCCLICISRFFHMNTYLYIQLGGPWNKIHKESLVFKGQIAVDKSRAFNRHVVWISSDFVPKNSSSMWSTDKWSRSRINLRHYGMWASLYFLTRTSEWAPITFEWYVIAKAL